MAGAKCSSGIGSKRQEISDVTDRLQQYLKKIQKNCSNVFDLETKNETNFLNQKKQLTFFWFRDISTMENAAKLSKIHSMKFFVLKKHLKLCKKFVKRKFAPGWSK